MRVELDEVDVYSPDSFVESVPHEMFTTLRREAPVYAHPRPDGTHFWCITRHDDLITVNRDNATYSSNRYATNIDAPPADSLEQVRLMMLNMDPPDHTKLRKLVNKGFTPRRIRELTAHLEQEATEIVNRAREKGEVDFVTEVAADLPLIAIAEFLGIPVAERSMIFDRTNALIGFDDPEYRAEAMDPANASMEMFMFAQDIATRKRADLGDDIVSDLLTAEVDGETLSDLEFNLFFMLLCVAGSETTRNAVSHGMHALLTHPDQLRLLVDDPGLLDGAIDEILRWATPVMNFRRTTTRPVTIRGVDIPEDEAVVFWHISANRDEAVFDDPFRFDITRVPDAHASSQIAFGGGGPHFCLGANLARAEMKVLFEALLPLLPGAQLVEEPRRLRSNFINGLKEMKVRFS
jgi:cholest-4-en-3-one 26-monooxygenase